MTQRDEIRKKVSEWFQQKITYRLEWMISSENDIQDELLSEVNEMGFTFEDRNIEYDSTLLDKVVEQITDSIMTTLKEI